MNTTDLGKEINKKDESTDNEVLKIQIKDSEQKLDAQKEIINDIEPIKLEHKIPEKKDNKKEIKKIEHKKEINKIKKIENEEISELLNKETLLDKIKPSNQTLIFAGSLAVLTIIFLIYHNKNVKKNKQEE